jgi:hypothetical protein
LGSVPQAADSWPEEFGKKCQKTGESFHSENLAWFGVRFDTSITMIHALPGSADPPRGKKQTSQNAISRNQDGAVE